MSISSIAGSTVSGISSAASGAWQAGSGSFASLFESARNSTSPAVNSATTGTSPNELTRKAEATLSEFKRSMQQLLSAAGIDDSFELSLSSDGLGGITVNADHPDREKVEQLLRENPDLMQKFNEVVAAYRDVRTSSEQSAQSDLAEGELHIAFLDGEARATYE